jgi:hypothetical protein
LNVADAGSRRARRVNFVGLVQSTPRQETEAFREGEGVKALRIQGETNSVTSGFSGWKRSIPYQRL